MAELTNEDLRHRGLEAKRDTGSGAIEERSLSAAATSAKCHRAPDEQR
jgi:hypothetical protein